VTDARRPASKAEQDLVRWMLEYAALDDGFRALLPTVDGLQVVDVCDCGCPSVDFVREGQGAGAQILADATGTHGDGCPLSLLLWGRDGAVSGLEIFGYDGGTWFPLPPPSRLVPTPSDAISIIAT
jgi:hypothetical protein